MAQPEPPAQSEDPNPWFCTLCGRMSSPNHIGRLHAIALFDVQTEVSYLPRTAEQVAANVDERSQSVLDAHQFLERNRNR